MVFKVPVISTVLICLTGCVATTPAKPPLTYKRFSAPLLTPLQVETGEDLFVEGAFIPGEKIDIPAALDLMIPGSMMIPFPAHIDPGTLRLTRVEHDWKYFCGKPERVAASFPGLGSVIAPGDCVGIRVSTKNAQNKQWVVDNSVYNRMNTVWTSSLSAAQSLDYPVLPSKVALEIRTLKQITFDGYFGNQLHFTWNEADGSNVLSKEFTFDFNGEPALVGIKGMVFNVKKADNLSLSYEWVKLGSDNN